MAPPRPPKSDYFKIKVKSRVDLCRPWLNRCFVLGEKSSSGHLEFSTLQDAVEALVICNHIPLSGASTSRMIRCLNGLLISCLLNRCQVAVHDKVVLLNATPWSK